MEVRRIIDELRDRGFCVFSGRDSVRVAGIVVDILGDSVVCVIVRKRVLPRERFVVCFRRDATGFYNVARLLLERFGYDRARKIIAANFPREIVDTLKKMLRDASKYRPSYI